MGKSTMHTNASSFVSLSANVMCYTRSYNNCQLHLCEVFRMQPYKCYHALYKGAIFLQAACTSERLYVVQAKVQRR